MYTGGELPMAPDCTPEDDFVTIINYAPISVSAGLDDASICEGGNASISVTAAGGSGAYDYQWQYYNTSIATPDWENVADGAGVPVVTTYSGATTATLTASGFLADGSYQYQVIISDQALPAAGGCDALTSATATITVVNDPFLAYKYLNS